MLILLTKLAVVSVFFFYCAVGFPAGIGAFLKNAWNKEPVIVASCAIGLVGKQEVVPYSINQTVLSELFLFIHF